MGLDPERGFDHGTFAPAAVIYPQADVPVFQVSLMRDYDPARHLALGRALAPLREEGVVIIFEKAFWFIKKGYMLQLSYKFDFFLRLFFMLFNILPMNRDSNC